jgi:chloramphenicol O-acetyltransferase
MPWMAYTHISHTNSGKKEAHHSFVDGIHIGQFVDKLQEYLDEL